MIRKKSENDQFDAIKDALLQCLSVAVKGVGKLTNHSFELTDAQMLTQFPAESALSVTLDTLLMSTQEPRGFCTVLMKQSDVRLLLSMIMEQAQDEVVIDEFASSAVVEVAQHFFKDFYQSLGSFIGHTFTPEPAKISITDKNTVGIPIGNAKLLVFTFQMTESSYRIPMSVYFDYSSISKLIDSDAGNQKKPLPNDQRTYEVEVKEIRVPKYAASAEPSVSNDPAANLDLIMNVPLMVSIEIGKAKKKIKDIMNLSSGYVLELEKQLGAPVDVVVNGQLIARGDVVVIDENFAIRITEIVSSVNIANSETNI